MTAEQRLVELGFREDRAERICTCYEKTNDLAGLEAFIRAFERLGTKNPPAFASSR